VSPAHCIPKDGAITIISNDENSLIPTRTVTGYSMCIDFRKLNKGTKKKHKPPPLMEQILERLSSNSYFCFLDGYSGYTQIPIQPEDQEKTTSTCPYGAYAYRLLPFGLCNAAELFKNVFLKSLRNLLKTLWMYLWMILLFTRILSINASTILTKFRRNVEKQS
jgi:hypothetical protein